MSCNTFLISTPTPGLRRPHSHAERIFWANYTLPLFWLALFDEDSIVEGSNDGHRYPGLSKWTKPALLLACERFERMEHFLGGDAAALFGQWVDWLEKKASAYLHCDAYELYGTYGDGAKFEQRLRDCVRPFDQMPTQAGGRLRMKKGWKLLVNECSASVEGNHVEPEAPYTFCGAGWHRAPWDS